MLIKNFSDKKKGKTRHADELRANNLMSFSNLQPEGIKIKNKF